MPDDRDAALDRIARAIDAERLSPEARATLSETIGNLQTEARARAAAWARPVATWRM